LGPDPRRVSVHVPGEGFLTAVDDLHRPARVEGEHRRVHLNRQILATSERTADAGKVNPDLRALQPETGRDLVTVDVQPLGGDVDVDAPAAVRDREARLRAEEGLILDAQLVDARD